MRVSCGGATVRVRPIEVVSIGEELSVTETVKDEAPGLVGVPVMLPVAELRLSPVGRSPLTDQV